MLLISASQASTKSAFFFLNRQNYYSSITGESNAYPDWQIQRISEISIQGSKM